MPPSIDSTDPAPDADDGTSLSSQRSSFVDHTSDDFLHMLNQVSEYNAQQYVIDHNVNDGSSGTLF